jgi:hypothetical protein
MPTNEQILIASILDKDLAEVPESILPMTSKLQLAMQKAFLENLQGPNVDALRRCITALKNGSPYRGTVAYEALAIFSPKEPEDTELIFYIFDLGGGREYRESLSGRYGEGGWKHATVQSKTFPEVFMDVDVIYDVGIEQWVCTFQGQISRMEDTEPENSFVCRHKAVEYALKTVKDFAHARTKALEVP